MRRLLRIVRWVLGLVAVVVLALVIAGALAHEPRPEGIANAEAETLAASFERMANVEAWERTGAVRFGFGGTHQHLWDRERGYARVRWEDAVVLLHAGRAEGRAYRGGREVHGEEARELLDDAHARFINDTFWLNPLAKLRDEGVSLSTATLDDGTHALLVSYSSGGLTPGDAYLWIPDDTGVPRAWRMWVSILPIGGLEVSWERWVTLETGARIATRHVGPLGLSFELTDVEGAETLGDLLEGDDPFAPLHE